jgi:hypothetical protein
MAFNQTPSDLGIHTPKIYILHLQTESTSISQAWSTLKRKFSQLEGQEGQEMDSPISGRKVNDLNPGSDVMAQFKAVRGLQERVDTLKSVSPFPTFSTAFF